MSGFWWPMEAPPLPDREEDVKNGWPWIETNGAVGFIRRDIPADADSLVYAAGEGDWLLEPADESVVGDD